MEEPTLPHRPVIVPVVVRTPAISVPAVGSIVALVPLPAAATDDTAYRGALEAIAHSKAAAQARKDAHRQLAIVRKAGRSTAAIPEVPATQPPPKKKSRFVQPNSDSVVEVLPPRKRKGPEFVRQAEPDGSMARWVRVESGSENDLDDAETIRRKLQVSLNEVSTHIVPSFTRSR